MSACGIYFLPTLLAGIDAIEPSYNPADVPTWWRSSQRQNSAALQIRVSKRAWVLLPGQASSPRALVQGKFVICVAPSDTV